MEGIESRIHQGRKTVEDYNGTRPGPSSSSYGPMPKPLSMAKPHHNFMSMYNPTEDSDMVHQQQATLERLEALRVASELEAFRHRHMLEFPETTITRLVVM